MYFGLEGISVDIFIIAGPPCQPFPTIPFA